MELYRSTKFKLINLFLDKSLDVDLTRRAFAKRRLGDIIEVARDGEEALALLPRWEGGAQTPSVILLDLKLPKVSGLEVLKHLKEHPRFQMIPVIILTTSQEDGDIEKAYRLGANSYIVKPVEFEKFIEVAARIDSYWRELNRLPRSL